MLDPIANATITAAPWRDQFPSVVFDIESITVDDHQEGFSSNVEIKSLDGRIMKGKISDQILGLAPKQGKCRIWFDPCRKMDGWPHIYFSVLLIDPLP